MKNNCIFNLRFVYLLCVTDGTVAPEVVPYYNECIINTNNNENTTTNTFGIFIVIYSIYSPLLQIGWAFCLAFPFFIFQYTLGPPLSV